MNTFANALFTLLFGWLRTLMQGIWSAVSAGTFSRFFTWLGDHWLWVAVLLCVACTVVDYFIWLIRWRPYLVWRSKMSRLVHRLKGGRLDSERRFSQGYKDAVPLDIPQDAPPPQEEEWIPEYRPEPAWQPQQDMYAPVQPTVQPVQEALPPQEEYAFPQTPAAQPPLPEQPVVQRRYFPRTTEYQVPPVYIPSPGDAAFRTDMPAARRKRRSDKYDRQRLSWHERLIGASDEEERMLDGLPPAVDREQAFHEPVYPAGQSAPYSSWQKPDSANRTNG